MSSDSAPDVLGPLVGWRYWRLDPVSGLLSSLSRAQIWEPGNRFTAGCRLARNWLTDSRYRITGGVPHAEDDVPGNHCTCGVYAARDLRHLRGQMLFGLGLTVVGEVSLWGKVIPGSSGYRAEHAYPRHLFAVRRTADWNKEQLVDSLAVYGVPVETINYKDAGFHPLAFIHSLISKARAFGRPSVSPR